MTDVCPGCQQRQPIAGTVPMAGDARRCRKCLGEFWQLCMVYVRECRLERELPTLPKKVRERIEAPRRPKLPCPCGRGPIAKGIKTTMCHFCRSDIAKASMARRKQQQTAAA